ncbi:serine/threonine protein phosphatase [Agrobacterium rubi]|nr:serine/threonine protein phosphatase [Agrobacterium rubi]NTF24371.1 serine/threonine protein phosphatase [Agrobacterium rubi]
MIRRQSLEVVTRRVGRDEGTVEYAIGDVHGCVDELTEALDWCASDAERLGLKGRVHLLGDYIDRGPDSKGVLDLLMKGPTDSHMDWLPIMGNHDEILALAWRAPAIANHVQLWWDNGGQQTLQSFGWNPAGRLPGHLAEFIDWSYIEFIEGLPHATVADDVLFVHAGIRPGVAFEDQALHDLLYIRGDFMRSEDDFGCVVVHGHTPNGTEHPKAYHNRVALDSGCFSSGALSVAAFDPGCRYPRLKVVGRNARDIPMDSDLVARYVDKASP